MLIQQTQPLLHENVVIRYVPGGGAKLGDSCPVCELNPDFRDQHSLEVKANQFQDNTPVC
jgi:hypothetical protein